MANHLEDCFYDCLSDSESDEDSDFELEDHKCGEIVRAVAGYCPNFDDPAEIRRTLERVANTSRLLLRSVGGDCDCFEHLEQQASRSFFYPATLEICARLLTDKSPPIGQCRLRGDPVTLKLPMELNPYNGQVNLNIFQPGSKPLTGAGGSQCVGAGDRRTGQVAKPVTGPESEPGSGVVNRASFGLGPAGIRRHTQRHDGVQKSGRKVRWPDVL
ncbi:hypothetical protein ACLKA6_002714 [Drosophila palustris]